MTTPAPIGPLYYDLPRAVQIRDPEDLNSKHSAVHGAFNVLTDSMKQTTALLQAWPVLMQKFSDSIQEILNALQLEEETLSGEQT